MPKSTTPLGFQRASLPRSYSSFENLKVEQKMKCKKCGRALSNAEAGTHWKSCLVRKKNGFVSQKKQALNAKIRSQITHIQRLEKRISQLNKEKKEPKKIRSFAKHWLYSSQEWKELRYKTLRRYGFKCLACNATNVELHIDHIVPVSVDRSRALDPENLQVLCRDCNLSKSNKFEDDLREKSC